MSIKKISTNWNKEKITELVMLSGHGDLANEGNKKSQRLIKELKEYLLTDHTNYTIASHFDISQSQFEKDMKYWREQYQKHKDKSLLLQEETLEYSDIKGLFTAYIPSLNKIVQIELEPNFKSLDDIRLDVRKQISKKLGIDMKNLKNIQFELNMKWNVNIQ